jgi:hypothetical protein
MSTPPYTCDDVAMPRPATGETPKRNIRIEDAIWDPALQRARHEKRTLTAVVKAFLARYGRTAPAGAPVVDPWDVVNLVAREFADGVGPDTNLDAAVDAAADLLRTLGLAPQGQPPA